MIRSLCALFAGMGVYVSRVLFQCWSSTAMPNCCLTPYRMNISNRGRFVSGEGRSNHLEIFTTHWIVLLEKVVNKKKAGSGMVCGGHTELRHKSSGMQIHLRS